MVFLRCDSSSKMKGGCKITLKAKFKKFKQDKKKGEIFYKIQKV
jgi:hypothetical protein